MRSETVLLLVFTLTLTWFFSGTPAHYVYAASSTVSTISISPTHTCCGTRNVPFASGDSFSINVNASILGGQAIQGFDVRVNYTNPQSVLQAQAISYNGNVFASYQNSGPVVDCIDGISQGNTNAAGCGGEIIGQVHFAETVLGPAVAGPVSGVLFTVLFKVVGSGNSTFLFDRTDLSNPNPDPSNPQFYHFANIPLLKYAGIFGNQGAIAFFNYQPADTSVSVSVLPNQPVTFDASQSFVANNDSLTFSQYSWNFGDLSSIVNTANPVWSHSFPLPGNYTVSLTVTDTKSEVGTLTRRVEVMPALGALDLVVQDRSGNLQRGNVMVQLFNSSSSQSPFLTKTVNQIGTVKFSALIPGTYYLTFTGQGLIGTSVSEKVIPGWTTMDTVYVGIAAPPPDYSGLIYLGTILGGLAIVTVVILYQRTKASRLAKTRSSSGGKFRSGTKSSR